MGNQIREFADCCLNGGTPDASGRSVRHTMTVIEGGPSRVRSGMRQCLCRNLNEERRRRRPVRYGLED